MFVFVPFGPENKASIEYTDGDPLTQLRINFVLQRLRLLRVLLLPWHYYNSITICLRTKKIVAETISFFSPRASRSISLKVVVVVVLVLVLVLLLVLVTHYKFVRIHTRSTDGAFQEVATVHFN